MEPGNAVPHIAGAGKGCHLPGFFHARLPPAVTGTGDSQKLLSQQAVIWIISKPLLLRTPAVKYIQQDRNGMVGVENFRTDTISRAIARHLKFFGCEVQVIRQEKSFGK